MAKESRKQEVGAAQGEAPAPRKAGARDPQQCPNHRETKFRDWNQRTEFRAGTSKIKSFPRMILQSKDKDN